MMNDHQSVERIDLLMGCGNLLSFLETFSERLNSAIPSSFFLLIVDLNNFMTFNEEHGQEQGDAVLHWVSIVLKDTKLPVYRIGGDEVVVVFSDGTNEEKESTARAVFDRLNRESEQFAWSNPASVMLIHFGNEKLEIADLWIAISDALYDAKVEGGKGFLVKSYTQAASVNNYQIRVINTLTERLLSFASRLDVSNQLAYLDPNTQLPNSLAAEKEMERTMQQAQRPHGKFSILLIDGDNLRLYNDISYLVGDEMIRNLANTLSQHLRPGDFLARWRVGDEFFVILPETPSDKALHVAERLRAAVEDESKAWRMPVSISIGMAEYPTSGANIRDLLDAVERSAKQAKDNGKNQVVYL
ncbi:MAG: diguanylate cyclase [Anaerolineales bacterium]